MASPPRCHMVTTRKTTAVKSLLSRRLTSSVGDATASALDMRDTQLGNYLFEKKLGEGGAAPVWKVRDRGPIDRELAVKLFVAPREKDKGIQELFDKLRRDLQPLEDLNDLPVVRPVDWKVVDGFMSADGSFSEDETAFKGMKYTPIALAMAVMEYADGGDIQGNYRDQVVRRDPATFLRHMSDVVEAIKVAHERGVVHRDIKPSNLFWHKKHRNVKVGDWGIARISGQLDHLERAMIGSLPYMSPESFDPSNEDNESRDIYALGCTLFQLYTGEYAFIPDELRLKASDREVIDAFRELHSAAEPPMAVGRSGTIPISYDFSVVIRDMMLPEPADRPSLDMVSKAIGRELQNIEVPTPDMTTLDLQMRMPRKPYCVTDFAVNAEFRKKVFNETPVFLCFNLKARSQDKIDRLYATFANYYGESFTLLETFGRFEFIAKVWSDVNGERLAKLLEMLAALIVDDRRAISVFVASEVIYPKYRDQYLEQKMPPADVLAAVHDIQVGAREKKYLSDLWKKLKKERVVFSKYKNPFGSTHIPCYCFVDLLGERPTIASLEAESSRIASAIVKCFKHRNDIVESAVIYRRDISAKFGEAGSVADIIVEFTAPEYDRVVQIPEVIFREMRKDKIATSTMLASKRYGIISDWPRALGSVSSRIEPGMMKVGRKMRVDVLIDDSGSAVESAKTSITKLAADSGLTLVS